MVTPEIVRKALRQVKDPELGLNIIDIGLIYDVTVIGEGDVNVKMTLTSPGCPAGAEIMEDAKRVVEELEGVASANDRAGVGALLDPGEDGSPGEGVHGFLRAGLEPGARPRAPRPASGGGQGVVASSSSEVGAARAMASSRLLGQTTPEAKPESRRNPGARGSSVEPAAPRSRAPGPAWVGARARGRSASGNAPPG